jgi:hypothetical protein
LVNEIDGEGGLIGLVVQRCAEMTPDLSQRERDWRAIGGARGDRRDDDVD